MQICKGQGIPMLADRVRPRGSLHQVNAGAYASDDRKPPGRGKNLWESASLRYPAATTYAPEAVVDAAGTRGGGIHASCALARWGGHKGFRRGPAG
jgi:hypothetical protein